jgi:hypothetical protein
MALGCKVIDLVGLDLLKNPDQVGGICQVPVMQDKVAVVLVRVLVEVVNAICVKQRGPALDAVNEIAFG